MTQVPDYGKAPTSKRRQFVKRWLIRSAIAVAALGLIVSMSLLIWGAWETRQLDREIAALHAAGEPSVLSDLDSPAIDAAENCVPELQAAAQIVDKQSAAFKAVDDLNGWNVGVGLPLRPDEHKLIRAALDASAQAFPLVDSATTKPSVGLGLKFTSPAFVQLFPDLNEQRALSRALSIAAYDAQASGDTEAAFRRAAQILKLGRVVDHFPNIVGHLVSTAIDAAADRVVVDVAADVGQRGKSLSTQARDEATKLIAEFHDDAARDEGLRRALQGERVMGIDAMQSVVNGTMNLNGTPRPASAPASVGRQTPRGWLLRNARAVSWYYDDLLTVLEGAHDATTFRKAYAAHPSVAVTSPRLYMIARILVPSMERAVYAHFRGQADRHLAAAALAVMLYRADHGGAFPKTLTELVPKYLPAIPSDPLSNPGATLGYVADPDRPRVYSVGENGVDNGGTPEDPQKSKAENDRIMDLVIDLLPQTRPVPETRESE
jgi:hypothetical protein